MKRIPVEIYGGPIVSTWLDRPLALAGRIALRTGDGISSLLYYSPKPVGIIPNLAIHLNREVNKGFEYNCQNHLPVLVEAWAREDEGRTGKSGTWLQRHLASECGLEPESVLDADLFFVESHSSVVMGDADDGFGSLVNAPRLDDLAGCHAILQALLSSSPTVHGQIACFLDAEEIGSKTSQGADSSFLRDLIARICLLSGCDSQGFYRALAKSFSISLDAAQAWHPAYGEKYDENFSALLNGGPAIKANANYKYATDSESESAIRLYCSRIGIACQKFMSRADMTPGSTIGPVSSALTGIKTVDIGHPLLSMHSIRETVGTNDHEAVTALVREHFTAMARFEAR
jgi:aspartyl aminopeptidase